MTPSDYLDLYDFRMRVFEMYRERNAALGRGEPAREICARFRATRDELFAMHPQSALDPEERASFRGLEYFPYDEAACVVATVDTRVEAHSVRVQTSTDESLVLTTAGQVRFELVDRPHALTLYWIDVYGGGLFLPFRDATAPDTTYGGGRYLFDTVKGSDFLRLPDREGRLTLLLDFNYAYNPSCAYNYRWSCPLAPQENHLRMPIRAGEKKFR